MNPSSAILVCDRDHLFREALRNFLLAAGYSQVEVVATAREAMAKLREKHYGYVLISLSRPFSLGRRLAMLAQKLQPGAKVFLLVSAADQPYIKGARHDCIIKEQIGESLLGLLQDQ
jgi:DNA-binding NarL/FixJ family response regulator